MPLASPRSWIVSPSTTAISERLREATLVDCVTGMWAGLWQDVVKRIYITLGMTAFILIIPLALTSFNSMVRRLGAKAWQNLHYSVYPLRIIACLHYGFLVTGNQLGP